MNYYDTEVYAELSDCLYWERPEADCAGPRVGQITTPYGNLILCENHYNNPPA